MTASGAVSFWANLNLHAYYFHVFLSAEYEDALNEEALTSVGDRRASRDSRNVICRKLSSSSYNRDVRYHFQFLVFTYYFYEVRRD